ncbi:EDD domain protein, DegV family [Marinitoga piezophila KA3]|uniref:EDD domain protein, DegV family n=1 Tax=Marinitoga piezophila (strain DSM 14283 / JCM 11233 / KA3) TaxID=443254 RepID=H2J462_MARPK|nr:DegV family protein [Marinitoga piezophila]AEX85877.1 EDD domain protein, DegV family [Marinitoga piezophila KA3]
MSEKEKIAIVADSGCGIPKDIVEKYDVKIIPLRTIIDGKEYNEGEFSQEFLYERMDNGDVKTSLPNPDIIRNTFEELIRNGKKRIITFNLSGSMSGTFNIFRLVSNEIMQKYEDVEIVNIDTLNISIGGGLVAYRAAQMIFEEGKSFEEVAKWADEYRFKSKIFFVIPTLKYLAKGGRIGKVSAKIGEMLNIKPIISNSDEGIYYTVTKVRGLKRSYDKVYQEFLKFVDGRKHMAAVYISGTSKELEKLQKDFVKKIESLENNIEVLVGKVSSTIGVHSGPDMFGIAALVLE